MKTSILGLIAAFAVSSQTYAAPIVVDGDLSDWNVTVGDNNTSDFSGVGATTGYYGSFVEDQNDTAGDGGFLGPNHGGQNYDAEFMATAVQGGVLYIAIVSGQRPDNGFQRYSPGDLLFETSAGLVALEIGGGIGGGVGTPITEGASGSTYATNGNGFTTGHSDAALAQTAGSLWTNVDLIMDPIAPATPVQFQINGGSSKLGDADYVFTRNNATTQHSIIELALDMSLFGGANITNIQWAPACGNDVVEMLADLQSVPLPSTMFLLPLGLLWLRLKARA